VVSSEKQPEIRCRQMKSKLLALESFGPAVRDRILQRFSKATVQAILVAQDEDWLPIEFNIELCECVKAEVGEQGVYEWGLKTFNNSINSSIIAPFIRVALNLFKTGPATLLQLGPHLWKTIYRNCGEISINKTAPKDIQIIFQNLPLVMARSRICMIGMAAFLQGMMPFSGVKGNVLVEQLSEKTQSAVINASWE
jgi:hypothetical protein